MIDPLMEMERPLQQEYAKAHEGWKSKEMLANAAKTAWTKQVKSATENGEIPPEAPEAAKLEPEPHRLRLVVADCTIEKLAMICAEQPKGVLQHRDELSGWLHGMMRYSNGSDRPFWLQATGGRSYSVERVGRPSVHIPRLLINVLGGIQPDKVRTLFVDGDDDGLLARFIPVWPDPVPLTDWNEEFSDDLVRQIYEKLHALQMPCDHAGNDEPKIIAFDAPARDLHFRFREDLRIQERDASRRYS